MSDPAKKLRAWWNGYDVVAASSEEDARAVVMKVDEDARLRGAPVYDSEEEADGDGWRVIPDDKPVVDEDGKPTGHTFGDVVIEKSEARYLWGTES